MSELNIFKNIGATNHSISKLRAENDYYATDPIEAHLLLEVEPELYNIQECACGEGHLAKVFDNKNKLNKATDLIDRDYGAIENFLYCNEPYHAGDIITNPPYKYAKEFVEHALDLIDEGRYVCMFLKVLFLESRSRKQLFQQYPPKTIYISSSRINCAKNGDFNLYTSSAIAYAWFVWQKGYNSEAIIKWIN